MTGDIKNKGDLFLRELMVYRKRIYAFILTLVSNSSDAEEIMQETVAVMWEKYQDIETVSNFVSWGVRIAHFKVLEFRKKKYQSKVKFDNELLDSVLGGAAAVNEQVDERFEALEKCLAKLDNKSRQLVKLRHQSGNTIKSIAESLAMDKRVAYRQVGLVHDQLLRCVRRTLREEGAL